MADWLPPLLEKLNRLRAADPAFLVTGASDHRYRFGPKCPQLWLTFAEEKYDIQLPEQFRRFITEVGNGGCGPWYGLQRFGYLPSAAAAPQAVWTGEHGEVTIDWGLTRIGPVEFLPDGSPTDGFETRFYDAMRALVGGDTILAEPFPFSQDSVSEDEMMACCRFGPGKWPVPGAWHLSEYGCGRQDMLVLNGPRAGEVWAIFGSDCGAGRLAHSFAEWYDGWLEDSLQFCAQSFNYRRIKSLFATNDRPIAEELLARFQSAAIRSELEQRGQTVCVLVGNEGDAEARRIMAAFNAERRNGR